MPQSVSPQGGAENAPNEPPGASFDDGFESRSKNDSGIIQEGVKID